MSIVNTCIVTQVASHQSRQAIRRAIKDNPGGLVAAVGCYPQVFPEELCEIKGLALAVGNAAKDRLPELLQGADGAPSHWVEREPPFCKTFPNTLPVSGRTRAMLKIQDGCDSFCSYCIVPYARGPVRSLEPERVMETLAALSGKAYREVVLTGIHLGRYGVDLKPSLTLKDLLAAIGREKLPLRIRLSSLEPKEVSREIVEMVASEAWLCRHFHIPLQSGDNHVIQRMNRHYTAEEFRSLIETIHRQVPLAAIGVDILAGFPGEDERAFLSTYTLVKDLPLSYFHVFPFSARTGTPASTFPDRVPGDEIKERAARLRLLGQEKRQAFFEGCVGNTFAALTEGWHEKGRAIKGLSDNYLPVVFPSTSFSQGELVGVRVERVDKKAVQGTRLTPK